MDCCEKNTAINEVRHSNDAVYKEKWVDIARGLAILAVITDHSRNTLYSNDRIQRISFFSVTLFILIMGVTTYWSYNNSKTPLWKKVVARINGIFVPYVVATFFVRCYFDHSFSWESFYYSVWHFNAAGPYYYVLLYIQLLLISSVMFLLIKELGNLPNFRKITIEILWGVILSIFARFSNLYTDISGIYASKLFGGSYILCMYIGMLVGLYYDKVKNMPKLKRYVWGFVCTISMIVIMYFIITKGFFMDKPALLGTDINPPGVTLLLFAVSILLTLCLWNAGVGKGIIFFRPLEFIGKHTLYIFLYHNLLMTILNRFVDISTSWIKALLYYVTMIVVPICIEMLLTRCKKLIVKGYLYRKEC